MIVLDCKDTLRYTNSVALQSISENVGFGEDYLAERGGFEPPIQLLTV